MQFQCFFTFFCQIIGKLSFPDIRVTSAILKNFRVRVGRSKSAGLPYFFAWRNKLLFCYSSSKLFGASYSVPLKPRFVYRQGLCVSGKLKEKKNGSREMFVRRRRAVDPREIPRRLWAQCNQRSLLPPRQRPRPEEMELINDQSGNRKEKTRSAILGRGARGSS